MTRKRKYKCKMCGYMPSDICQLDILAIDGCCKSSDPSDYTTLRLNCPQLKAEMHDDYLTPGNRLAVTGDWRQGDLFN